MLKKETGLAGFWGGQVLGSKREEGKVGKIGPDHSVKEKGEGHKEPWSSYSVVFLKK